MNTINEKSHFAETPNRPFSRIEEMINSLAIFKLFGAVVKIEAVGSATATITQTGEIHAGGFQSTSVNGMVVMGLLDASMCSAALSHFESTHCATVEMSVKFMKPVFGTDIRAMGSVISTSKDLFYCQASISDNFGRIKALATGIVKSAAPPKI